VHALDEARLIAPHRRVVLKQPLRQRVIVRHVARADQHCQIVRPRDIQNHLHRILRSERCPQRRNPAFLGMFMHLHPDQRAQPPLGQLRREQRDVRRDEPLCAQPPHAPRHGGGRQRHVARQFLRRRERIALEQVQQLNVEGVELAHVRREATPR